MIDENIAEAEKAEKQHIVESLKSNEKKSFAQRIDALTEKFKDNPAVLRVIASVASEYAELNQ
jgi:predicted CopG family antitoxin